MPSRRSCQHGLPSLPGSGCQSVPRGLGYYTALRIPCSVGRRSGSPCGILTTAKRLFLTTHRVRLKRAACWRVRFRFPRPHPPWENRGLPGYWAILFARALVITPRRCAATSPTTAGDTAAFRQSGALGSSGTLYFRGHTHTAHALAVYASTTTLPASLQDSLLACRAQLWPDGVCTHWMTNDISGRTTSFLPYRPALPGRSGLVVRRRSSPK